MSASDPSVPVYGLILAGGHSTRMHRDKAALKYQGKTQLDRTFELASRHVAKVFVSVRANQTQDLTRAQLPMIVDCVPGEGPIVGIRSAFAAHPNVAWLVLACDLPFLSDAAIERLLRERHCTDVLGHAAIAYNSAHDGLPEPLCAIWEPASTPEEYDQALAALDHVNPMQLKIQYYALMREQAGRSEETLETSASTPADLYQELAARYGFTLSREQLKVAVNSEFSDWSRKLSVGDAVVFIPPVAGG
jgi:molybdopterin-guanine dinucleotide biosynthesis protein A